VWLGEAVAALARGDRIVYGDSHGNQLRTSTPDWPLIHALSTRRACSDLFFGFGLTVSQMINPAKVIAFIEVFGDFDPSLAFVMATAIPVTAAGYALTAHRHAPICAPGFSLPTRREIDRPLVLGAVLFGIGWGLVGYCPGPALAGLGLGNRATGLLVFAMLIGMGGHTTLPSLLSRREKHA
jgi:uncharacterized protein